MTSLPFCIRAYTFCSSRSIRTSGTGASHYSQCSPLYFRIVQKLLTVVIEPPTENPAPLSTSNPRQLPSFMPAGPRKRPDDGVQSILLEDLLKTAEKSYLKSVRHNDAVQSSSGRHLSTLRSVVEVESLKATTPMSVVVDPSLNPYTTRTAVNEGISMDYSPGDLDGYTFDNPILSGELQDSEEVSLEDLDFHSRNELLHWRGNHVDDYLQELLRHEDQGPFANQSCRCGIEFRATKNQAYRCTECHDWTLYCQNCIVIGHEKNPFHIVEVNNGVFFESRQLASLGLVIHLGNHSPLSPCAHAIHHPPKSFTIIGIRNIQTASLKFCACKDSIDVDRRQLLRARLFPATSTNPQTAATFEFLNFFHILSFMSKVSMSEYYQTLERMTDNTGRIVPPNRLRESLRLIREWRFLMLLKRSGQGHKPEGAMNMQPGDLVVRCLPCPHFGINIDPASIDSTKAWLTKRFQGLDANFRCTRTNVSSEAKDPSLNSGNAFFCDDQAFQRHLGRMSGRWPIETSDCNDHDAIKLANKRGTKNLAVTGIAMASCTRHECIFPQAVADLRLGEEYIIMDYVNIRSLHVNPPLRLTLSYDVMCQYSKKFEQRIKSYGDLLPLPDSLSVSDMQLLIPKFHLMGHQNSCRHQFAFNYANGTGKTDGESVERVWAESNTLAGSTKKMGPGSRRDTLDDHWNDWNWRKSITLGKRFLKRGLNAIEERLLYVPAYEDLCKSLDPSLMEIWRGEIARWDENHSAKNPYESSIRPLKLAHIRLNLAKEDALLAKGDHPFARQGLMKQMTPTTLILQGLELEEQQRRLIFDHDQLGKHATPLQLAKIVERATNVRSRAEAWIVVQALYMPVTTVLRAESESRLRSTAAGDIQLFLPGAVFDAGRTCDVKLIDTEWRLRFAAAHDELEKIRKYMISRTCIINYKQKYGHGQREGTRTATALDSLDLKIQACAARYRMHYNMIVRYSDTLGKSNIWHDTLRPLKDTDMRDLDGSVKDCLDGARVSWIWLSTPKDVASDEHINDSLRIAFCKARVKALRSQEECILIQEEMRRSLVTLEYEAVQWESRADGKGPEDLKNEVMGGPRAYAFRQAHIRRQLAAGCLEKWDGMDIRLATGPGGISLKDTHFSFVS
ncbi:hypothetical protein F5879DRAFT_988649 [Lentinula edodes]|nr:hypothetical protein F5879DRAFT_988649 [Lentinula edodes]